MASQRIRKEHRPSMVEQSPPDPRQPCRAYPNAGDVSPLSARNGNPQGHSLTSYSIFPSSAAALGGLPLLEGEGLFGTGELLGGLLAPEIVLPALALGAGGLEIYHAMHGGGPPRPGGGKKDTDPDKDKGNETVKDVLKGKKGSIRNAPLPPGSPSWNDVENETMDQIEQGARENKPGYRTIKKLLTDKRFNK